LLAAAHGDDVEVAYARMREQRVAIEPFDRADTAQSDSEVKR
jgi:hypothetical protein